MNVAQSGQHGNSYVPQVLCEATQQPGCWLGSALPSVATDLQTNSAAPTVLPAHHMLLTQHQSVPHSRSAILPSCSCPDMPTASAGIGAGTAYLCIDVGNISLIHLLNRLGLAAKQGWVLQKVVHLGQACAPSSHDNFSLKCMPAQYGVLPCECVVQRPQKKQIAAQCCQGHLRPLAGVSCSDQLVPCIAVLSCCVIFRGELRCLFH